MKIHTKHKGQNDIKKKRFRNENGFTRKIPKEDASVNEDAFVNVTAFARAHSKCQRLIPLGSRQQAEIREGFKLVANLYPEDLIELIVEFAK